MFGCEVVMIWECEEEYNNLKNLSKDQLIQIIDDYHKICCFISETLVEESKWHITSNDAVKKVRGYLCDMPYYPFYGEELSEQVNIQMERNGFMEFLVEQYDKWCDKNLWIGGTDE